MFSAIKYFTQVAREYSILQYTAVQNNTVYIIITFSDSYLRPCMFAEFTLDYSIADYHFICAECSEKGPLATCQSS